MNKKPFNKILIILFLTLFFNSLLCSNEKSHFLDINKIKKQADLGDVDSQILLADYYLKKPSKENVLKARKYLQLAYNQKSILGTLELSKLYFSYKNVFPNGKAKAISILEAHKEDFLPVKFLLGKIYYEENFEIMGKKEIGISLIKESASNNHIESLFYLGKFFESQNNHKEAFKYFKKAAEKNYPLAVIALSLAYRQGKGCPQSEEKADELLELLERNPSGFYGFNEERTEIFFAPNVGEGGDNLSNSQITLQNNIKAISIKYAQKIYGISLTTSKDGFKIVQVFKNSPADKADIQTGSTLLKIDDQPISDWDIKQVVEFLNQKDARKLTIKLKDGKTIQVPLMKSSYTVEDSMKDIKGVPPTPTQPNDSVK